MRLGSISRTLLSVSTSVVLIVLLTPTISGEDVSFLYNDAEGDVVNGGEYHQTTYDDLDLDRMSVSISNTTEGQWVNVTMEVKDSSSSRYVEVTGTDGVPQADAPILSYTLVVGTNETMVLGISMTIGEHALFAYYVSEMGPSLMDPMVSQDNISVGMGPVNDTEVAQGWKEGDAIHMNVKPGALGEMVNLTILGYATLIDIDTQQVLANDSLYIDTLPSTVLPDGFTRTVTDDLGDVEIKDKPYLDVLSTKITGRSEHYSIEIELKEGLAGVPTIVEEGDDVSGIPNVISYTIMIGNDTESMMVTVMSNLGGGGEGSIVYIRDFDVVTGMMPGQDAMYVPEAGVEDNETVLGKGWMTGSKIHLELNRSYIGETELYLFITSTEIGGMVLSGQDMTNIDDVTNASDFGLEVMNRGDIHGDKVETPTGGDDVIPVQNNITEWDSWNETIGLDDVTDDGPVPGDTTGEHSMDYDDSGEMTLPVVFGPPSLDVKPLIYMGGTGNIVVYGSAASEMDGGNVNVQLRIDEGDWTDVGSEDWDHMIELNGLTVGNHTVTIRSFDGERYSNETSVTFEVPSNDSNADDVQPEVNSDDMDVPAPGMVLICCFVLPLCTIVWRRIHGKDY